MIARPRPAQVDELMRETRQARNEPLPYLETIWCPLFDDRVYEKSAYTELEYFQIPHDGCNVATSGHLCYPKGFVGQGIRLESSHKLPYQFIVKLRIGEEDIIKFVMRGEHENSLFMPTPIYTIPTMQYFKPSITVDIDAAQIGQHIKLTLPGWLVKESQ